MADEDCFEEVPRQPSAEEWKDPWTDQGDQGKLPEQYNYAVVCSSFIPNPFWQSPMKFKIEVKVFACIHAYMPVPLWPPEI